MLRTKNRRRFLGLDYHARAVLKSQRQRPRSSSTPIDHRFLRVGARPTDNPQTHMGSQFVKADPLLFGPYRSCSLARLCVIIHRTTSTTCSVSSKPFIQCCPAIVITSQLRLFLRCSGCNLHRFLLRSTIPCTSWHRRCQGSVKDIDRRVSGYPFASAGRQLVWILVK
jgi:hypothetical protein